MKPWTSLNTARLQVLDLRNLVDSPAITRAIADQADHPHSCAHDRDHQQAHPHFSPTGPGVGREPSSEEIAVAWTFP